MGFVTLRDAETGELVELDTRHPRVREMFDRRAGERAAALTRQLKKTGVDQLEINTDETTRRAYAASSGCEKGGSDNANANNSCNRAILQ